jgi:hypothetical protein
MKLESLNMNHSHRNKLDIFSYHNMNKDFILIHNPGAYRGGREGRNAPPASEIY